MKRKTQNLTTMMIHIFAQTYELLLFGLSIPFNDALILRAGVYMLFIDLESSDTESMTFVLDRLAKNIAYKRSLDIFIQLVLLA
jgi:hypothetical protein